MKICSKISGNSDFFWAQKSRAKTFETIKISLVALLCMPATTAKFRTTGKHFYINKNSGKSIFLRRIQGFINSAKGERPLKAKLLGALNGTFWNVWSWLLQKSLSGPGELRKRYFEVWSKRNTLTWLSQGALDDGTCGFHSFRLLIRCAQFWIDFYQIHRAQLTYHENKYCIILLWQLVLLNQRAGYTRTDSHNLKEITWKPYFDLGTCS